MAPEKCACCKLVVAVVVVAHIYPPITGQRQTLTIGQPAHFSLL